MQNKVVSTCYEHYHGTDDHDETLQRVRVDDGSQAT